MGFISEETIQRVIAASDIVALISAHVPLKRAGALYKAPCPFHSERTPSFVVTPSRNTFHCFGCGAGGGVVKFVEMYEHLSFPEAIRRLAERAGIPIIEAEAPEESMKAHRERRSLLVLHQEICEWFHQLLLKDPQAGAARAYWKSRGLDGEVARSWKIGYAPPSADAVVAWAQEKKIDPQLLSLGGILMYGDEDGGRRRRSPYFRFAHRLIFPLCNEQGEVLGFSGRILVKDDQAAKYLNSPETPIFNKGKLFFGFHKSRRAILKQSQAVVCEGQLDLITCYEHGLENVIAPLGTAFTEHHARLLKRMEASAVLCFDADNAGRKAAGRAYRECAKAGVEVGVVELPTGQDPDSLIREQGPDAFRARLQEAKTYFDFQINHLISQTDMSSVRERTKVAETLSMDIAHYASTAQREDAINRASLWLKLPGDDLRKLTQRALRQLKQQKERDDRRQAAGQKAGAFSSDDDDSEEKSATSAGPLTLQEVPAKHLCRLLLTDQASREWIAAQPEQDWLRELPDGEIITQLIKAPIAQADDAVAVATYLSGLPSAQQSGLAGLIQTNFDVQVPLPPERVALLAAAGSLSPDDTVRPYTMKNEDKLATARSAWFALRREYVRRTLDQYQARIHTDTASNSLSEAALTRLMQLHQEWRDLASRAKIDDELVPF
jgi:DNA primase